MLKALKNGFLGAALHLALLGFPVFPLQREGKHPLLGRNEGGRGWKDATTDEKTIRYWWNIEPFANIGIPTGEMSGFFILDIDGEAGENSLRELVEKNGGLPATVEVTTGKGRHLYFRMPDIDLRNSASKLGTGLDIRGNGGYAVAPPSLHENGRVYAGEIIWEKIAVAPQWLLQKIQSRSRKRGSVVPLGQDMQLVPEGQRNDSLFRYGSKLRAQGYEEEQLLEALMQHNEQFCEPPLPVGEVEQIVESVSTYPPGEAKSARSFPIFGIDFTGRDWTDMGSATRLVEHLQGRALYCGPLGGWLLFTGKRWERDTSSRILRAAKKAVMKLFSEAEKINNSPELEEFLKFAKRSQSLKSLKAAVELAAPEVAVRPEAFDQAPMVINLENVVLDLDRMEVDDEHRPDQMQTKLAPVEFQEDAECPTFLAVLHRTFGGNEEMIRYIQRICGYCLTGDIGERCLFILVGTGANGKSTFLNILCELLGDYAMSTPVETLMVKPTGGIPNDVARLRGARVVTASEGELGQRLAESLVKRLTGQDRVTARFLHKEFFDFVPQFKIFLATNHAPQIRGNDEGIWDRIKLLPFNVRIPEEERDPKLGEKLRAEMPGILRWAIEGCIEWKERGLDTPDLVRQATSDYRKEMDLLGRFLEDCTFAEKGSRVSSKALYEEYRTWCDINGERPETKKMIGVLLKERGFHSRKSQGYPQWLDLKLR